MRYFLRLLRRLLKRHRHGKIQLNHGTHNIEIEAAQGTRFLSWRSYGTGVCVGSMDTFGTLDTEKGFLLIAEVKSQGVEIVWFVVE